MNTKTCCVTGHRQIQKDKIDFVKESLCREIEQAIADGYTNFITGFASGVDQYFAEIVMELKQDHPWLKMIAAIPYRGRLKGLRNDAHTRELLDACNDIVVVQEEYMPYVYACRNRYMVEHSERVISVFDGRKDGGTLATIRIARSLKKELREITLE